METIATVEKSSWDTAYPWQVRIKKSEIHGTKGSVLGRWRTKKKASAFAEEFNKAADSWKKTPADAHVTPASDFVF